MPQISHVAEIIIFAVSAAAAAVVGQIPLMPQVRAWEAELIAVLIRDLPRL
jgi:hypothetical protein